MSVEKSTAFQLPSKFQTVAMPDDWGNEYLLVVEAIDPPSYEQRMIADRPFSEIALLLRRLLRGSGTLIDLGANIGTICLPVAASGNRIVAVEMLPQNVAKLTLSVLMNRFPHFRVVQAAVGESDGLLGYAGTEAWGHVSSEPTATQAVALRLDTIVEMLELEDPDFIRKPIAMKIDIEGHELAALQGAERLLTRYRPPFIFESIIAANAPSASAEEVKALVTDQGYRMYILRGGILAPHRVGDPQIGLVSDILAIPIDDADVTYQLQQHYELRALLPMEQIAWLDEMAHAELPHRLHAVALIPKLWKLLPGVAEDLLRISRLLRADSDPSVARAAESLASAS